MIEIGPVPIEEVYAANERISAFCYRTPLVRLNAGGLPAEIYLKLENLQPYGSFKVRGVSNLLKKATKEQLKDGICTVSSGNLGLALAWMAKQFGHRCTVVVPDTSSDVKLASLKEAGARIMRYPFEEWFEIVSSGEIGDLKGHFVHPSFDSDMMEGNGTIALEILADLPDVDAVIMPYGGGGLCCGLSFAIQALKPDTKLFVSEIETSAPVYAALAAGEPKEIEMRQAPIHCVGSTRVMTQIWPWVSRYLTGSIVVTPGEVVDAIRLLAEKNRVIAEGSGALPVAAARTGKADSKKVVCVVTGGNIDIDMLVKILSHNISPGWIV